MLNTFSWDARYETGIALVDVQHRTLVHMLNGLIEAVTAERSIAREEVLHLLDELGRYAQVHFADEEALMASQHCDPEHVHAHRRQHSGFVDEVVKGRAAYAAGHESPDFLEKLARFVTTWLSFHILGSDMEMARLLERGETLASGQGQTSELERTRSAILVDAMQGLYNQMAERNQDLVRTRDQLAQLNTSLEARVKARTAELERALAEVERTRSQLAQAEKMSAIGRLAAGVAHEINNPIGFVRSNLGTLDQYVGKLLTLVERYDGVLERIPFSETGRGRLAQMREQADYTYIREDLPALFEQTRSGLERVRTIVQAMRDFSSLGDSAWTRCDLAHIVTVAVEHCRDRAAGAVALEMQRADRSMVSGSAEQLGFVITTLLDNALDAVDALDGKGVITVELIDRDQRLECRVIDNGCGMEEQLQSKVFDPFFTTKPVGAGIGLSLSMAYEIVRHHGGHLTVTSQPRQGSCFSFDLPVTAAEQTVD